MRAVPSSWREWLSTLLFPFKIYCAAVIILLTGWQIAESMDLELELWDRTMSDFTCVEGGYIRLGYLLSGIVLILGGSVQFKFSQKTAILNIAFGIAAFSIGWLLQRYLDPVLTLF